MTQGIIGLLCAVISLIFFPPVFGIAGIIFGVLSLQKGQKGLGITAIVLSAVFMLIGFAFGVYVHLHPNIVKPSGTSSAGAVIEVLFQ